MNAVASPDRAAAPAPAASLSRTQLKAMLWADATLRVFGLVMGSRITGLPERLARADVGEWHCLEAGALEPEQAARAAYQVELQRDAAFTDWLLFDAAAGHGDWGVVVSSVATPLALRGHARRLGRAVAPDGTAFRIDWIDPTVLRLLLPTADAGQLDAVFGPIDTLVVAGAASWQFHRVELGALRQRHATVLKAP